MDQHAFLPMRGARGGKAVDHRVFVHDIDSDKARADRAGDFVPQVRVDVEDRHFRARRRQRLGGCAAKPRSAAGHNGGGGGINLHQPSPLTDRLKGKHAKRKPGRGAAFPPLVMPDLIRHPSRLAAPERGVTRRALSGSDMPPRPDARWMPDQIRHDELGA
jgi:hypothetical protein